MAAPALAVLALCTSCGGSEVDLSPLPTTAPVARRTVCDALPRQAVERAVGRKDIVARGGDVGLDRMRGAVSASCLVFARSAKRDLLLDITYSGVSAGDNQLLLAMFRQGHDSKFSTLPSDLGTGILDSAWSSNAPDASAQVTMIDGANRLQITIERGPRERDQPKDVVALARLLEPYFPRR